MTPADTQAALAAATATLESPGDPLAWLHARDVLALVACVSALRDVLTQTERERDSLAAAVVEYERAIAVRHEVEARFCFGEPPADKLAWRAARDAANAQCDAAYAALRDVVARGYPSTALARVTVERDEARALAALVTTYRKACAAVEIADSRTLRLFDAPKREREQAEAARLVALRAHIAALAALRETPAGEGER